MENYLQYKKQTAKVQRYFRKGNAQEIGIFASTLQKWAEWKKNWNFFFPWIDAWIDGFQHKLFPGITKNGTKINDKIIKKNILLNDINTGMKPVLVGYGEL